MTLARSYPHHLRWSSGPYGPYGGFLIFICRLRVIWDPDILSVRQCLGMSVGFRIRDRLLRSKLRALSYALLNKVFSIKNTFQAYRKCSFLKVERYLHIFSHHDIDGVLSTMGLWYWNFAKMTIRLKPWAIARVAQGWPWPSCVIWRRHINQIRQSKASAIAKADCKALNEWTRRTVRGALKISAMASQEIYLVWARNRTDYFRVRLM